MVPEAAVLDPCSMGLCWTHSAPLLLFPFSLSQSHILSLPALSFSTYPQKLKLRGREKGATGSGKGLGSPSCPDACTHPALSQTKDGDPSPSVISFLLLKPCHGHAVGGMELNSTNTSSHFLCNHDSIKILYKIIFYISIAIDKAMVFLIPYIKTIIYLVNIFSM